MKPVKVYVVSVQYRDSNSKISQEGYPSLESAQAFIQNREGSIKQISPFHYCCEDLNIDYLIHEIVVKGITSNVRKASNSRKCTRRAFFIDTNKVLSHRDFINDEEMNRFISSPDALNLAYEGSIAI